MRPAGCRADNAHEEQVSRGHCVRCSQQRREDREADRELEQSETQAAVVGRRAAVVGVRDMDEPREQHRDEQHDQHDAGEATESLGVDRPRALYHDVIR